MGQLDVLRVANTGMVGIEVDYFSFMKATGIIGVNTPIMCVK